MHKMDVSYIINEYGEDRELYFNAVAPPIIQTSNFVFKTVEGIRQAFADEYSSFLYSRGKNPTVEILRKKLAALEGAEDCLVLNSGAAAIFAAVIANVKAGDHIVSVDKPYSWAQKMFNEILPKFGVTTTYVDGRYIENFERAILPNTAVIYLEAVAELARSENIITICDNSYCSPLYQQPILFGIDLVLHSATKYIGGHSDTVAGVLCGSREMIARIFKLEYMNIGSGIQPFNAWLLIRGLRTLPTRLEQITKTTREIVAYLKSHPQVEQVIFPFDEDFPQYELAKKQMKNACGLLTFVIKANGIEQIEQFCESLKHIFMAVSWGGHESLILPKCAGMDKNNFDLANKEHRMIRLYCGLEEADYLKKDLSQAFERIL
jgi:cystathionine beta-lyase/cystathionine gamma-synthase